MLSTNQDLIASSAITDLMDLTPLGKDKSYIATFKLSPDTARERLENYRAGKPTESSFEVTSEIVVKDNAPETVNCKVHIPSVKRNAVGDIIYEYMYISFKYKEYISIRDIKFITLSVN